MLKSLAPAMCKELVGRPDLPEDRSFQWLLEQISEMPFLHQKGPTVLVTRWASWMSATEWMLPQLSSRLLALLYVGLQVGYVTKGGERLTIQDFDIAAHDQVVPAAAGRASSSTENPAAGHSGNRETLKADKLRRDALYVTSRNSMHVAAVISSHSKWTSMSHMLLEASRPYLTYVSHWRHSIRDQKEAWAFALGAACGTSMLEHSHRSFDVCSDHATLESAVSQVHFPPACGSPN